MKTICVPEVGDILTIRMKDGILTHGRDSFYSGDLLKVIAINSTHIQLEFLSPQAWRGDNKIILVRDEYDFSLANDFIKPQHEKEGTDVITG